MYWICIYYLTRNISDRSKEVSSVGNVLVCVRVVLLSSLYVIAVDLMPLSNTLFSMRSKCFFNSYKKIIAVMCEKIVFYSVWISGWLINSSQRPHSWAKSCWCISWPGFCPSPQLTINALLHILHLYVCLYA